MKITNGNTNNSEPQTLNEFTMRFCVKIRQTKNVFLNELQKKMLPDHQK